jgi:hypothetical protein
MVRGIEPMGLEHQHLGVSMHHRSESVPRRQPLTDAHASRPWLLAPLAAAALLVACGGGSGDSSPSEPVAPTPTPTLAINGTAATGAALAGREVQAKCATGTGTATTGTNGSYSISITNGALPCVLRTTLADGTPLLSLATGTGSTATGNITPLSHWVAARLAGTDPQALYDSFDAGKITGSAVDSAVTAVLNLAKDAGIDFTSYGNPLTATLVAAAGSSAGNDFDKALDALKARMDSVGLSIASMATTVAANAPTATQFSGTVSLPPELLLQPKAAHCSALRSGNFRYMIAMPSGAANQFATGTFRLDATTLGLLDTTPAGEGGIAGESSSMTPVEGQPCRFNTDSGTLTVAGSGALIFNSSEEGVNRVGIALPIQTFTVALGEGTWNGIGLDTDNGVRANRAAQITLNASGQVTAGKYCADIATCETLSGSSLPELRLELNANGGFNMRNVTENKQTRAVAFRPGGGIPVIVELFDSGELFVWSRERTLTLPAVTGNLSASWNHTLNNNLTAAAVSESANTIVSTDAATGRYQRDAIFNLATGATQRETLALNDPRNGYTRRLAETVQGSDGSTRNVSPWTLMSLPGAGFTPVALQTAGQGLIISVGKAQ